MRVFDVGTEPVGVVAIGANATGIIAIGQLATGVIAIGQLARGVIVVGQLSLGVLAVGQLSLGVGWSAGMVGAGGTSGPWLVFGAFGRLFVRRLLGRQRGPIVEGGPKSPIGVAIAVVTVAFLAALWWVAVGQWLLDAITRTGGSVNPPVHVLR